MSHVFFSYAREDRARVKSLVETIEAHGLVTWWDRELIAGDRFAEQIEHALQSASAVVVCWSTYAVQSSWVRDEASRAMERGILVPVLFDLVSPPLGFGAIQAEDLSDWQAGQGDDPRLRSFVAAVIRAMDKAKRGRGRLGDQITLQIGPRGNERRRLTWIGDGSGFSDIEGSPELVTIPAGSFVMGAPDTELMSRDCERPCRRVHIERPFAISRHPVTAAQWQKFTNSQAGAHQPPDRGWGGGSRPVVDVNYADAESYANWLTGLTGKSYRLPSEAEWEYACRADTMAPFWWGDSIHPDWANYLATSSYNDSPKGDYRARALPSDWFAANPWGLQAMHGNVWEWVSDCWHANYTHAPQNALPWGAERGGDAETRVLRGGSWSDPPHMLRCAARRDAPSYARNDNKGFRVLRELG